MIFPECILNGNALVTYPDGTTSKLEYVGMKVISNGDLVHVLQETVVATKGRVNVSIEFKTKLEDNDKSQRTSPR